MKRLIFLVLVAIVLFSCGVQQPTKPSTTVYVVREPLYAYNGDIRIVITDAEVKIKALTDKVAILNNVTIQLDEKPTAYPSTLKVIFKDEVLFERAGEFQLVIFEGRSVFTCVIYDNTKVEGDTIKPSPITLHSQVVYEFYENGKKVESEQNQDKK